MKLKWKFIQILVPLLLLNTTAKAGEILIVSDTKSDGSITVNDVKEAYLGRPVRWGNGKEVHAIDRKVSPNGVRNRFFQTVLGRSMTEMKAYWSQLMFTGRGYPPQVADDLEHLRTEVNSGSGMIGFLDQSEPTQGFKVILRIND